MSRLRPQDMLKGKTLFHWWTQSNGTCSKAQAQLKHRLDSGLLQAGRSKGISEAAYCLLQSLKSHTKCPAYHNILQASIIKKEKLTNYQESREEGPEVVNILELSSKILKYQWFVY